MSDDLSEELLALADTPAVSRKRTSSRSSSKPSKRRKPTMEDSDDEEEQVAELESEDDEDGASALSNPYPLDGMYKDEADRARIQSMPELEREEIIATRLQEKQASIDKRQLDAIIASRNAKEDTGVAQAAKRQHTSTGTSQAKTSKLEVLKKKRLEKERRMTEKGKGNYSPTRRGTSGESSDEEEGGISRFSEDEMEEKAKKAREIIGLEDLERVRLSRRHLADMTSSPHFEEYVIGSYVRYMIGLGPDKRNTYRICQIVGIERGKFYEFEKMRDDRKLTLKHGKSERGFTMEQVSESHFTLDEFRRWSETMKADKLPLPSRSSLQKKKKDWEEIRSRKLTDADITAMVNKKKNSQGRLKLNQANLNLNRRRAEHTMAIKRQDYEAAEEIALAIAALQEEVASLTTNGDSFSAGGYNGTASGGEGGGLMGKEEDLMAKLNEKNRKSQQDAIRKADADRREQRRAAALLKSGNKSLLSQSNSGTSTPTVRTLDPKDKWGIKEIVLTLELDLGEGF
ncbi:Paf1/RNA polymerase II complex, RTF1 component (involved in regulation of TATA box-binding protein) [Phaffia rhodozyma]|uniref:Paf1/RNA polymerase II complex, RTF1 component (Involved in regulation of TATA box-binding protein) n=1 Tax=Phaffia rhodozyma TaxID=264483 RepID=A0A0F7SR64_PHARH|nr:Paf1/RNA polymerase II complex, RTF1 component (involved in regulation of TATA box-binding protein) [Phaffia rhodozyma]